MGTYWWYRVTLTPMQSEAGPVGLRPIQMLTVHGNGLTAWNRSVRPAVASRRTPAGTVPLDGGGQARALLYCASSASGVPSSAALKDPAIVFESPSQAQYGM
jgi:hypothetical protein